MRNMPDYSSYHLKELEQALKEIDVNANPKEAKLIRGYMAKGGYTYPETKFDRVEFTNAGYKWSLVVVLLLLFFTNLFIFLVSADILSMVPAIIQGVILLAIYKKHKYTRLLIQLWSALLILSAIAGFIAMFYAPDFNGADVVGNAFRLFIGAAFFVLANKYVRLVPVRAEMVAR